MLTLEQFLISIERKAFRIAQLAVKNDADALDLVQDSMFKLAQKYGHWQGEDKSSEWRPLFYRILQNRILDFHRSNSRHKRFIFAMTYEQDNDSGEIDIQHEYQAVEHGPEDYAQFEQTGANALHAIENLPLMQQQCFLLRNWEGFSVKETAKILNLTEGSIKTHHFRALKKLKEQLNDNS